MSRLIPVTYVPARNTIFLSYALALSEVTGTDDIFLGVSAIDYSGYPDCRPEYIQAFEKMANLAVAGAVAAFGKGAVSGFLICAVSSLVKLSPVIAAKSTAQMRMRDVGKVLSAMIIWILRFICALVVTTPNAKCGFGSSLVSRAIRKRVEP